MKKTLYFFIFFFAALLLAGHGAYADFYSYVDSSGVTHITNVPTSAKYVWIMREKRGVNASSMRARKGQKAFDDLIYAASVRYGVDPTLVKAIVKAESDFDSSAVSVAGARGLMQLMPETARITGVRDVHNPEENVEGGIRHLSKLLKTFDWNVRLAVAAYNAGEKAVIKYGTVPPYEETRNYVKRVLYYYDSYKRNGP